MHPFSKSREDKAGKARARQLLKGYKSGGAAHSDEAEDRKLFGKMIKEHDVKVSGAKGKGRLDKFARGGRAKKSGNNVNILIAPQSGAGPSGGAASAPGALPPPGAGPIPKPPMIPPQLAGGPPPGGPMGGPPGPMKRGGRVKMKGGAESGVGRLDKKKAYGAKARKG